MAGYIINIVVGCLVGLIFILLGICQCRSESPVGMNTGEKPPRPEQLSDVKAWNQGHGRALIRFGIVIAVTVGAFPLLLEHADVQVMTVAFIVMIVAEIAGLEVNHVRLERRYKIK
ncbi:MAG: hypothetical protein NC331_10795 [Lachnospiraceae bacterium]|nr:hypothetical protein [Lachnospiraceae bacterium]MCM1239859.1 hypothetical protein [Lachnospiraceae bacterium]